MGDKKTFGCLGLGCFSVAAFCAFCILFSLISTSSRVGDSIKPDSSSQSPGPFIDTHSDPAKKEDWGGAAFEFAKRYCKDQLKAPSSAKFSSPGWDEHTGWNDYGYNQWKVFGYVDAQNTFGAMLRDHWIAVVKKQGDFFSVQYFKLGDQSTGKLPPVEVEPLSSEQLIAIKKNRDEIAASAKIIGDKKILEFQTESSPTRAMPMANSKWV